MNGLFYPLLSHRSGERMNSGHGSGCSRGMAARGAQRCGIFRLAAGRAPGQSWCDKLDNLQKSGSLLHVFISLVCVFNLAGKVGQCLENSMGSLGTEV